MNLPFEFYIPFKFVFEKDTYIEDLQRNNSVTVKGRGTTNGYTLIRD